MKAVKCVLLVETDPCKSSESISQREYVRKSALNKYPTHDYYITNKYGILQSAFYQWSVREFRVLADEICTEIYPINMHKFIPIGQKCNDVS